MSKFTVHGVVSLAVLGMWYVCWDLAVSYETEFHGLHPLLAFSCAVVVTLLLVGGAALVTNRDNDD